MNWKDEDIALFDTQMTDDFLQKQESGERTMEHIVPYIEGKLYLKVNREKTKVAYIRQGQVSRVMDFTSTKENEDSEFILKVSGNFKDKIREVTGRSNGMSIEKRKTRLNQIIRGWVNYFKLADMKKLLKEWTNGLEADENGNLETMEKGTDTYYENLKRARTSERKAWKWANTRKGYWRIAHSPILIKALSNERFKRAGYLSFRG